MSSLLLFACQATSATEIYTLSLHDALPILAIAGNCAIWASHHIGKSGESDQAEAAYKGRGASAFGANVRSVINLTKDRKSTRLNSSHLGISYAVFCLKKKKNTITPPSLK